MSYLATDYHTGGEPFRIVELPFELPGESVADRRARAIGSAEAQDARRLLCFEPRGHADMYGGFMVPPDDNGADLGVLFWHKDGFSTACGHGTIALGAWAVESGLVEAPADGVREVVIDVPSGRVGAIVHTEAGRVARVGFRSVPAVAVALDVAVSTPGGDVQVDVAYGGAVYAHVDASQLGLSVTPENVQEFIARGREIRAAVEATGLAERDDPRLSGVYGVIFHEDLGELDDSPHQRNVTIFADGQVDRSPCGSGTASRVAMLAAKGRLAEGQALVHESIVGSVFTASYALADAVALADAAAQADAGRADAGRAGGAQAAGPWVLPMVVGTSHLTGRHEFVVDPEDALVPGFVLR